MIPNISIGFQVAFILLIVVAAAIAEIHFWKVRHGGNARWFIYHYRKDHSAFRQWLRLFNADFVDPGGIQLSLDTIWKKSFRNFGFKIHLGDHGSETPVDVMIGFYFVSFFFGVYTDKLGKFCEKITGGHKRDFELRVHDKTLWWKFWYSDDLGHDTTNDCDKWRKPRIPPWRWGRPKYRSWMCLREGNLDLNPLDAIWGQKYYSYTTLDEDTLLLEFGLWPEDEYMVDWKVQRVTRKRKHGPWPVNRETLAYYCAEWSSEEGIPFRNHDWKGDGALSSSVKIDDPNDWRLQACDLLTEWVNDERARNNYRPPFVTFNKVEDADEGIIITGTTFPVVKLPFGEVGEFSIYNMSHEAYEGDFTIKPFKIYEIVDGEALKRKYTLAELAQQAINRDKEDL